MKTATKLLSLALFTALVLARANAQSVDQVTVIKESRYLQTSAAGPVIVPVAPGPFYNGPYNFGVEVQGSDLSGITAPVITLASGSTFPTDNPTEFNSGTLTYNPDSDSWKFGLSGQDYSSPSVSALDTSFAIGTYGMTVQGNSFSLNFAANTHPANAPTVTLTGGNWVGGKYVIDPSQDLTITSNAFANYGANADGVINLNVDDLSVNQLRFYSDDPLADNFVSYTIPGGTMTAGQDYNGAVGFYALTDRPAVGAFPGALIATAYGSTTGFTISAVTPPPAGAQATFYPIGHLSDFINGGGGGGGYSELRDVTKTGGVIYGVGNSITYNGSASSDTGVLWTSTNGFTPLPNTVNTTTPNPAFVTASAITPDASYIAARTRAGSGGSQRHANRVTTSGLTNLELGTLPGISVYSAAVTISNDGSVMYGFSRYTMANGKLQAVRMTSVPSIAAIPFLNVGDDQNTPAPHAASSDGSVMLGTSSNIGVSGGNLDAAGNQAFRYVEGSGVTGIPFLTGGTWNGALALSADGNLALVAGNSTAYPGGGVYLYNATSTAKTSLGAPAGYTIPLNSAGMNADGSLVAVTFGSAPDACFLHNGSGWHPLTTVMTNAGVNLSGWSGFIVNGMSADGTLVWGNGQHNGGTEGWVAEFSSGYLAGYGLVHDFNSDGNSDILWQNMTTGDRGFWLMNGTTFASWVDVGIVSTDWRVAVTGDFNGDGKTDILWENTSTGERYYWFMNGTTFASGVSMGIVTPDWHIAATADFNGDGKTDILWENSVSGDRGFWLMNGSTFTSWQDIGVITTALKIVAAADFNGDGKADIVWENTSTGKRVIWFMNGTTFSSSFNLGIVGTEWHIAAVADFNNDGQADILWENTSTGDRGFWLMNGTAFASWVDIGTIATDWRIAP